MLRKISISNYALIDELSIEFGRGLTMITGETGAGKSILLGALQLLLGERADTAVLRDPARKCIVEGIFVTDAFDLSAFFAAHDLDEDKVCIIRREINASGKSRAFINDTPVNLAQIRELASMLVDIHSQHDNLRLESAQFQAQLLDAFSGNKALNKTYHQALQQWKDARRKLEALREEEARILAEQDYLQFQYQELADAKLQPQESELLEAEFSRLEHASEIIRQISMAEELLDGNQPNILGQIRQLIQLLHPVVKYTKEGEELQQRLQSVVAELKDIHNDFSRLRESSDADPGRLEILEGRLDRINHLMGKHRVKRSDELIAIREELALRLHQVQELNGQVTEAEQRAALLRDQVYAYAKELHQRRAEVIPALKKQVKQSLGRLGMPSAQLDIMLEPLEYPGETGTDRVKILFTANQGMEPKEIQKVASGGELSRLMLVLKKMIARSEALPSIIFDEIDTGVSGALADAMGEMLREMSADMQVLVITHLPQIASKADDHLKVVKTTKNGGTRTELIRLGKKERISEIAGMLSGKELSGEAISNAETLLGIRKK